MLWMIVERERGIRGGWAAGDKEKKGERVYLDGKREGKRKEKKN